MKQYKNHTIISKIPDSRIADVIALRKFIFQSLDIWMDIDTCYEFWCRVSDHHEAGWLSITYKYEGETREEFLINMMERFGHIDNASISG